MSCYKTSDNKYFDCPPRMSDARHFTDYRPNCMVNNKLRIQKNLKNSFEYRNFLSRNAEDIMKHNLEVAYKINGCGSCKKPYHENTMLPEKEVLHCEKDNCQTVKKDKNGLGQGRFYGKTKDFKRPNSENNCCGDSNSLFDYYKN